MKGTVQYYLTPIGENPVSDFLDSLTQQQQSKILRIFSYIEQYGLLSVIPHIKKVVGTPLWEIRILGKDNIRIFYIALGENDVMILHGFIKKKQKTPQKELSIALARYKQFQLAK